MKPKGTKGIGRAKKLVIRVGDYLYLGENSEYPLCILRILDTQAHTDIVLDDPAGHFEHTYGSKRIEIVPKQENK